MTHPLAGKAACSVGRVANGSTGLGSRGFSLVEILVSIAMASILLLVLVQLLLTAVTIVSSGSGRLFSASDAQAALDLIANDLRGVQAIPLPTGSSVTNPPEVFQAYVDPAGVALSGAPAALTPKIYPMQLFLLTTAVGESIPAGGTALQGYSSVPHLVRYRVAWQDPISGAAGANPVFGLYRDYVHANDTFDVGSVSNPLSSQQNNAGSGGIPGLGGLGDLYLNYWSVNAYWAGLANPPVADFLVGNIIDFQVLIYDLSSGTPTKAVNAPSMAFPSSIYAQTAAGSTEGQPILHYSASGWTKVDPVTSAVSKINTMSTNLVAEIKLVFLDQSGVKIFNTGALAIASPNMSGKYGRIFLRRVPLDTQ